ncbi:MAG: zinc ribbon domain-containing protein, partial [Anaerolineae bacterium]
MKCPKCGFENRPEARFCKACGQPLEAPAPAPSSDVRCPACGALNKPTARFCVHCGASLAASTPSPPAPPAYGP